MKEHKYKFSNKTRKRMSLSHMGKKHSPETIAKMREAKRNHDLELAFLIKMGKAEPFHHSEATKKLLRKLALKQKRRHKLTKAERLKGAKTQKDRGVENRFERKIRKQIKKGVFG